MTIQTFTWIPDYGAGDEMTPRINESNYGDGYSQRSEDGLNTQLRKFSLQFSKRTREEVDAIIAFVKARKGVESFYYPIPDDINNETALVVCKSGYKRTKDQFRTEAVSLEFVEVVE